jgi:hypothetical protein
LDALIFLVHCSLIRRLLDLSSARAVLLVDLGQERGERCDGAWSETTAGWLRKQR